MFWLLYFIKTFSSVEVNFKIGLYPSEYMIEEWLEMSIKCNQEHWKKHEDVV